MPILYTFLFSACFGLSLVLLVLESASLPWIAPWSQRLALWRSQQAARLRRLGIDPDALPSGWRPALLGTALGALGALLLDLSILSVVGLLFGLLWPRWKESQWRAQRAKQMGEQLPGLFEALAASLRAGQSLSQALQSASEDLPQPSAQLLREAALRVGLGEDPETALHVAGQGLDRALLADWRMLCTAVAVVRSSGGKLPELLDQLASTVRERQRLQALIRAQTAQAKLSGWVIGCLPPLLLVAMQALDPELIAPLFRTPTGWVLLAIATGLEAAGLFVLRKMAEVQV